MYLSVSSRDRRPGESLQRHQIRAEKEFEYCKACKAANEFSVVPDQLTCPKHKLVMICPYCLDHEGDYHLPARCPIYRMQHEEEEKQKKEA